MHGLRCSGCLTRQVSGLQMVGGRESDVGLEGLFRTGAVSAHATHFLLVLNRSTFVDARVASNEELSLLTADRTHNGRTPTAAGKLALDCRAALTRKLKLVLVHQARLERIMPGDPSRPPTAGRR